jgi:hypothetical protein
MQYVVAQILHELYERLTFELSVNFGLVTVQDRRAAVILPHEYARVLDERKRCCHKVVDAPRYLAMGLASSFLVGDCHQANVFVRIIHATRDLDELLGIHPKDVERE